MLAVGVTFAAVIDYDACSEHKGQSGGHREVEHNSTQYPMRRSMWRPQRLSSVRPSLLMGVCDSCRGPCAGSDCSALMVDNSNTKTRAPCQHLPKGAASDFNRSRPKGREQSRLTLLSSSIRRRRPWPNGSGGSRGKVRRGCATAPPGPIHRRRQTPPATCTAVEALRRHCIRTFDATGPLNFCRLRFGPNGFDDPIALAWGDRLGMLELKRATKCTPI